MASKFTLYLGLNDKDTKAQKIATVEAYKIVSNIIANRFDGGTIFEAVGIYKHGDGTLVKETTLRIELLYFEERDEDGKLKVTIEQFTEMVRDFVATLKEIFNQECVAVDKSDIASELW